MTKQLETLWKEELVARLRRVGAITLKLHGGVMQSSGWPDLFVGHRLYCGWAELKVGDGRCDDRQRMILRQLIERGVPAVVLRRRGREETVETPEGAEAARLRGEGLADLRTMRAAASGM